MDVGSCIGPETVHPVAGLLDFGRPGSPPPGPDCHRRKTNSIIEGARPAYWAEQAELAMLVAAGHGCEDGDRSDGQTGENAGDADSDAGREVIEKEASSEARAATLRKPRRQSGAYDLLEEGVALLVSACAAPTPDDTSWPGGWGGCSQGGCSATRINRPFAVYVGTLSAV